MRHTLIVMSALAVPILTAPAATAEPWQLTKISKTCSIGTQQGNRSVMIMHERDVQNVDGGELILGFQSPALIPEPVTGNQPTVRQGPPVRLEFDTGQFVDDKQVIIGAYDKITMATLKSDHIQREIDIVGKATRVRVTAGNKTDQFDLTGLSEALPSLIECVNSLRQ